MMKFIVSFAICAVLLLNCDIVNSAHIPKDSPLISLRIIFKRSASDDMMDKTYDLCIMQEKATDKDAADWKNEVKPKTKISKCLDACVAEKLGLMVNNKLVGEVALKYVQETFKDEKINSEYKTIVDGCTALTDPDRCLAINKIQGCLREGAQSRNVKELF